MGITGSDLNLKIPSSIASYITEDPPPRSKMRALKVPDSTVDNGSSSEFVDDTEDVETRKRLPTYCRYGWRWQK